MVNTTTIIIISISVMVFFTLLLWVICKCLKSLNPSKVEHLYDDQKPLIIIKKQKFRIPEDTSKKE